MDQAIPIRLPGVGADALLTQAAEFDRPTLNWQSPIYPKVCGVLGWVNRIRAHGSIWRWRRCPCFQSGNRQGLTPAFAELKRAGKVSGLVKGTGISLPTFESQPTYDSSGKTHAPATPNGPNPVIPPAGTDLAALARSRETYSSLFD